MTQNTTFLSKNIYYLLVDSRGSEGENREKCFLGLQYNWEEVGLVLGNLKVLETETVFTQSTHWFEEKIKTLWQLFHIAGEKLQSSSSEERNELWSMGSWAGYDIKLRETYENSLINKPTGYLEAVLKLTAYLERSLGNVYLLKGKQVPFLLKDLLATVELQNIFGKIPVVFMQLLFGCVTGLNIRNIAWHGFLSPHELDLDIVASLFILIPSLGNILQGKTIPIRPLIPDSLIKQHSDLLDTFSVDIADHQEYFVEAVNCCAYISTKYRIYWIRVYQLYVSHNYGESLILLLPQLEHMLRSVYCEANNCQSRMLTAENSSFYITLDDITAAPNEITDNKIKDYLGAYVIEMLEDMFTYQSGPRLRDRISHGEMPPDAVTKTIMNHLLFISICIMWKLSHSRNTEKQTLDEKKCNHQKACDGLIENIIQAQCFAYKSRFHPLSMLQREIQNVLGKLLRWNKLPVPEGFSQSLFIEASSKLKSHVCNFNFEGEVDSYPVTLIEQRLCNLNLQTLYRDRKEIEVVSKLRHITGFVEEANDQVELNTNSRFKLWKEKKLRSRARINYMKMWEFLPMLQQALILIINQMTSILENLSEFQNKNLSEKQKYLKLTAQYIENVVSLSSIDKNRWDEIKVLTTQFFANNEKFSTSIFVIH